jgi:hypothetical protein
MAECNTFRNIAEMAVVIKFGETDLVTLVVDEASLPPTAES